MFQSFHLLGHLTVLENVALPLVHRGVPSAERCRLVEQALERSGLARRANRYRAELSGAEQQSAAIAQAVAAAPRLLLVGEPAGRLGPAGAESVMQLLLALNAESTAICYASHDPRHARLARRRIELLAGRTVADCLRSGP